MMIEHGQTPEHADALLALVPAPLIGTRAEYLVRLNHPERHAITLAEMIPGSKLPAGTQAAFEVSGLGIGNSTVDWLITGNGRRILLFRNLEGKFVPADPSCDPGRLRSRHPFIGEARGRPRLRDGAVRRSSIYPICIRPVAIERGQLSVRTRYASTWSIYHVVSHPAQVPGSRPLASAARHTLSPTHPKHPSPLDIPSLTLAVHSHVRIPKLAHGDVPVGLCALAGACPAQPVILS